jgi:hypothetical protein
MREQWARRKMQTAGRHDLPYASRNRRRTRYPMRAAGLQHTARPEEAAHLRRIGSQALANDLTSKQSTAGLNPAGLEFGDNHELGNRQYINGGGPAGPGIGGMPSGAGVSVEDAAARTVSELERLAERIKHADPAIAREAFKGLFERVTLLWHPKEGHPLARVAIQANTRLSMIAGNRT